MTQPTRAAENASVRKSLVAMWGVVLAAGAVAGCVGAVERPAVHRPELRQPCDMGLPPPATVTTTGADPAVCLPSGTQGSVELAVTVSKDGRALAVDQAFVLCLELDADGREVSQHVLTETEKECALRQLADWRFTTIMTCHEQKAYVTLGSCGSCGMGAADAGREAGRPDGD